MCKALRPVRHLGEKTPSFSRFSALKSGFWSLLYERMGNERSLLYGQRLINTRGSVGGCDADSIPGYGGFSGLVFKCRDLSGAARTGC